MPFKSYISLFACISSIAASPTPPSPDGGRVSRRQTCQGSGVIQNTDTCSPAEGLTLEQAPTLLYPDIPDANNTGDVFVSLQSLANKGTGPEADLPPCQQEGVIENTDKCRPQYPETWTLGFTDAESQLSNTVELDASQTCPYAVVNDYEWLDGRTADATYIEIWNDMNSYSVEDVETKLEARYNNLLHTVSNDWAKSYNRTLAEIFEDGAPQGKRVKRMDAVAGGLNTARATAGNIARQAHDRGDIKMIIFGYGILAGAWLVGTNYGLNSLPPANSTGDILLKSLAQSAQTFGVLYIAFVLSKFRENGFGRTIPSRLARFVALLFVTPVTWLFNAARNTLAAIQNPSILFDAMQTGVTTVMQQYTTNVWAQGPAANPGPAPQGQIDPPPLQVYVQPNVAALTAQFQSYIDQRCQAQGGGGG